MTTGLGQSFPNPATLRKRRASSKWLGHYDSNHSRPAVAWKSKIAIHGSGNQHRTSDFLSDMRLFDVCAGCRLQSNRRNEMKTSQTMCTVGAHKDLLELDSAELRSVQGGFFGYAMVWAIQKANDYLVYKLVTEPGLDGIPIEPLT
jgi:hypothetical protein